MTPTNADVHLIIPQEYIGKPIEITSLSLYELQETPAKKTTMADFWGILSEETAEDLNQNATQSRKDWEERLSKQV
jgi:hypothetical protein